MSINTLQNTLIAVPQRADGRITEPLADNLIVRLKADLGTTPAGAGSVSAWEDQAGADHNQSQGTGGLQPTKILDALNGHAIIDGDGTEWMSGSGQLPTGAKTVYVVYRQDAAAEGGLWSHLSDTSLAITEGIAVATRHVNIVSGALVAGTAGFRTSDTVALGAWNILAWAWDGAGQGAGDYLCRLNRVTQTLTAQAGGRGVNDGIMRRSNGTSIHDGALAEILVYSADHEASDMQHNEAYFGNEYGV